MHDPYIAPPLDPFFVGQYRQKVCEIRGAIREIETITAPIRRAVDEADRRLAVLRESEAAYLRMLNGE